MALRVSRNHDRGDEQPDAERDRLWREMETATEIHAFMGMLAEMTGDPFWREMERVEAADRDAAVKAYEAQGG